MQVNINPPIKITRSNNLQHAVLLPRRYITLNKQSENTRVYEIFKQTICRSNLLVCLSSARNRVTCRVRSKYQDESTPLRDMLFRIEAKQSNGRDRYQAQRD